LIGLYFVNDDTLLISLKITLLFLGIDVAYYFAHRVAHKVNVLWGGHKVHHSRSALTISLVRVLYTSLTYCAIFHTSSEDYNFSTAVRQNAFEDLSSFMFFLPLAFFFDFQTFRFYFDINLCKRAESDRSQ